MKSGPDIAYEWCSAIREKREGFEDWESLLLICLEIGFRHLDFQRDSTQATITHTENHQELVDIAFKSQKSEVIADLLHAWTTRGDSHGPAVKLLSPCAGRLVGLENLVPSSTRLRRLVIHSVELTRNTILEAVGVERFIEFLNHLDVTAEDMDRRTSWVEFLVKTIKSSEKPQHLSLLYWELLAELATSSRQLEVPPADGLKTTRSLIGAEEWSKLECWMGTVWMLLPEGANLAEGDLEHSMTLLFRQWPEAVEKLKRWMERWGNKYYDVSRSFQKTCEQAQEAAKQDAS